MVTEPQLVALFDVDGTLYPADSDLMRAQDDAITDYVAIALGLTREEAAGVRADTLRHYGTTLRGLIELHGIDPGDYAEHLCNVDAGEFLTPNPELRAVLARMRTRRAILTNSPAKHAQRVIHALGLEGLFDPIFDIAWSGYIGKPHAVTYRKALHELGAPAESVTLIDDRPGLLAPARALGMRTVLVGHESDPTGAADARATSLLELPDAAPWLF